MEVITSNKGKYKVTFKGNMFVTKHMENKYNTRRCSKNIKNAINSNMLYNALNYPAILQTSVLKHTPNTQSYARALC